MKEAFAWLEDFIKPTGFVAGTKDLTLADISAFANISTFEATEKIFIDLDDYPSVKAWSAKMKTLIPDYTKANQDGVDVFRAFFKARTGLIQ